MVVCSCGFEDNMMARGRNFAELNARGSRGSWKMSLKRSGNAQGKREINGLTLSGVGYGLWVKGYGLWVIGYRL